MLGFRGLLLGNIHPQRAEVLHPQSICYKTTCIGLADNDVPYLPVTYSTPLINVPIIFALDYPQAK